MGHVASESPLWRTQQVTIAQRGGRMSSSTAQPGSLSAPHLASMELLGGHAELCPLSGLTSSGVFVNGIPSSGGLHLAFELKRWYLTTLWPTWPLNGIGSCSVWASQLAGWGWGWGIPAQHLLSTVLLRFLFCWLWLCFSILPPALFQPGC